MQTILVFALKVGMKMEFQGVKLAIVLAKPAMGLILTLV